MVGDGINDAPALAGRRSRHRHSVPAPISRCTPRPVVLMTPTLDRVTEVFDLSRDTLRVVKQNLFWAFFYNAAGITPCDHGYPYPDPRRRRDGALQPLRDRQLAAPFRAAIFNPHAADEVCAAGSITCNPCSSCVTTRTLRWGML